MKCDQIWPSKSPKTEFVCILPNLELFIPSDCYYPDIHAMFRKCFLCYGYRSDFELQMNNSEAVSVKPPAREFDGILPNISLPMTNDEY